MTYDLLLDALNMDKVVEAIHSVKIPQCDYHDAATMVLKALKRWGPTDYMNLRVEAVEERFSLEIPTTGGFLGHIGLGKDAVLSDRHIKGLVDLVGTREAGREVIDWKSTGTISSDQQDRLRYSWQGKLYGTVYQCQRVVFRTVQRDGRCTELRYPWPSASYCDSDVVEHYRQVLTLRDTLKYEGRWPKHAPYACKAFGRDCPYKDMCVVGNQSPEKLISIAHMSYSSCETFLLCPERFRLEKVLDCGDGESSRESDIGSAFHEGLACAYNQIKEIQ